ncbi:hypothetical protein C8C77_104164 [Halanaerobium saccharolyticum]|uniref:Flagellar Assembly Protein A N-terminal region domain-containing protein n=1 Tax=Halanaerobium saccharolyticum TaxID=43595 RepID=A0A4R7Z693_9FIRM|nr:FapA family protein [Halanaerobium saccharolyticum]RAK04207.1 hypothetical protein C7958_13514 [Halanaerobium saccharolyticum]TDW06770.1 hypothetical protein C8C77_104164 [Halanaerobium saccharolyticum]TDX62405.1 hypothetical protein C7956_104164 [Halanaerobium saccharolyticum]
MENKDGIVYLENGNLTIINPEGLGRYPRIKAGENVDIYIAGEKESKEVVVSQDVEDLIEFKINKVKRRKKLDIELTENKLKAYLIIEIIPEQRLVLKNTEAANQIKVETKSKEEIFPEVRKEEIIELLNFYNISYGIRHDYLNQILTQERNLSGKYLIAEGRKAEAGQNAEIIKSEEYKKKEENLFNVIDSIDKGEMICYKKKAVEGKIGINVFSERIPPPPVKDLELKAGKNVQLTKDGLKAVALEGGQPKLIRRRSTVEVHIYKQYIIKGDVDKYTGHIKYYGDLLVKGDVKDYFNVDVGNDLKVQGNIANAEVKTRGNLHVNNNIIASKLFIGNYLDREIVTALNKIIGSLENLKKGVEEILGEANKRKMDLNNFRTGRVLRLLIENKFPVLKKLILDVNDKINNSDQLKKYFKEITPYFNNMANIERITDERILYKFKNNLVEFIDLNLNQNGVLNIYAGYIQNSEINIGGSVIINRLGCYNSTIRAKKSIIVKSKSGFLKGGSYQAEEIVFAQEAGSKLSKTYFRVGEKIFIKKALGTLIIKSDKDSKIIEAGTKNINFKVNDFGQLVAVSNLPNINQYLLRDEEL